MECERIVLQQSEYMGQRMLGRKARWAGDAVLRDQLRKFGMYFGLLQIYSFLQSAGPILTAERMERGVHALPGKDGAYLESYGGRRFVNGQWPVEEPQIYPGA